MNAKIASGYHADDLKQEEVIEELQKLQSIRKQCGRVYKLAEEDKLRFFKLNIENLPKCADKVIEVMKQFYPDLNFPYHGRLRHFGDHRLEAMRKKWAYVDDVEKTRRLIDLITISVLLDAGAGPTWKFVGRDGKTYTRSEGLAVASLEMFQRGLFSSDKAIKHRVNSIGIESLKVDDLVDGFQITEENKMVGLEGRWDVIKRLGNVMKDNRKVFGGELQRPGHMLDYIIAGATEDKTVDVQRLWTAIMAFTPIFPEHLSGVRRGDVWCHSDLKIIGKPGSDLIPFHKLSQWLAMSLLEPIEALGYKFTNLKLFTCLAEYRNGGLLVDTNVLELKNPGMATRMNDPGSELIVEWRAMTICLIDKVAEEIRKRLGKTEEQLPLMSILEGGTWRAGRVIAKELRPDGSPPISIRSNGTVF